MDIDALIEKRAKQSAAERAREELWAASVRRDREKRRRELRAAWLDYHQGQAARLRHTLEALVSKHEQAAAQLLEEGKSCRV